MEKHLSIFSKYVEDNKPALTGIGVIATITALFLNLSQAIFGDSLKNLQLLLLLFLILGLIFLIIDSLFWFIKNADSLFSGLISFSLVLITWRIWEFILNNFRNELNQYLSLIFIPILFIIYELFNKFKGKAESNIDKKITGALSKAFLYCLSTFLFLYLANLFLKLYLDFMSAKSFSVASFFIFFSNISIWSISIWVGISQFCKDFFFVNEKIKKWFKILLMCILLISFCLIIWPIIFDLVLVLRKNI